MDTTVSFLLVILFFVTHQHYSKVIMDAEDPRKIHDDAKLSAIRATRETIDDRKQHFGLWSTLGLSYSIMNTPIALASTLILSVGVGGSPVYIFAYCVAFVFQVIVCVSLAEMAGAFPHPSGETFFFGRPQKDI